MSKRAILLACFNRKAKTLACLGALYMLIDESYDVYLLDDASTDGTADAVAIDFPKVNIIKGNGNLFWNRSMHLAWTEAAKKGYDFYLWLNDDTVLYPNVFREMFECSALADNKAIISGILEDKQKNTILYGGSSRDKKLLVPTGKMQKISNLNGNVVLVPKSVYDTLGMLDPKYHHDLGDVDYGLRAISKGIEAFTTRIVIGYGEKNSLCRERLSGTTLKKRFQKLYSPLGSNPNINFYFRRKHRSFLHAAGYYAYQLFLNLIPDWLNRRLFGNKYQ